MISSRRLDSENFSLSVLNGKHHLDVTLAYEVISKGRTHTRGSLHEVAFVARSKIGGGMDQMLVELGIALSRAIQGRDPDTGQQT